MKSKNNRQQIAINKILHGKKVNGRALGFFGTFIILGITIFAIATAFDIRIGGSITGYGIGLIIAVPAFFVGLLLGTINQKIGEKAIQKRLERQAKSNSNDKTMLHPFSYNKIFSYTKLFLHDSLISYYQQYRSPM